MTSQNLDGLIARIIYVSFFGGVAGFGCGLLPYYLGKRFGRVRLGAAGFYTCLVSGAVLGLILALPMMIIFTIAMLALGRSDSKRSWKTRFVKNGTNAELDLSDKIEQPLSEHEKLLEVARVLDQRKAKNRPKPNEPAA